MYQQTSISVQIKGSVPYLMNRFAIDVGGPKPGKPDYKKEVVAKLYKSDTDGLLYVPSSQIHGCLIEAGKQFKTKGKGTYSKILGAFILIEPAELALIPQIWTADERPVVVNKARVLRYRPKWEAGWLLSFSLNILDDSIQPSIVKNILDHAGNFTGIGDFRPSKGGPFGRFIVTEYKEQT